MNNSFLQMIFIRSEPIERYQFLNTHIYAWILVLPCELSH